MFSATPIDWHDGQLADPIAHTRDVPDQQELVRSRIDVEHRLKSPQQRRTARQRAP